MTHVFNERTKVIGTVDIGAEVSERGEVHSVSLTQNELLTEILGTLKKIEYHLSVGSDDDLTNCEV